jgi:transposase
MSNAILAPDAEEHLPARLSVPGRARRLADEERVRLAAEAVSSYAQGHDIRAVAGQLGVAYNTARLLLRGAGVELRSRGGARARKATERAAVSE